MRKMMIAAALVSSLAAVSACKKAGGAASSAADTTNNAVTSSNSAVATTEDKTAQAVGAASASTIGSNTDGGFVTSAAISDMYELKAAKLVEQHSKNPAVKKFAAQMIKDHTKSSQALKSALPNSGVNTTPPTELDSRRSGMLDNLAKADAQNFDKTYMDQQVAAHDEAVTLFKGYSDHGGNATLKAFASKTVPVIQGHRDMARQIQATLK